MEVQATAMSKDPGRSSRTNWCRTVLAFLWLMALCPAAHGQTKGEEEAKKEAKQRFAKGVEFFNDEEYAAALAEFHWAYEVAPHYTVLYNIARCYSRMGTHLKAIDYFEKYLEEGGDKVPGSRKKEVLEELEKLKKIIAYLDVDAGVKGASVTVDGKLQGTHPLGETIRVEPGPHTVAVEAEGFQAESKDIIVASGATVKVSFDLKEIVKWASLKVDSAAAGAVVVVDQKEKGKAPWQGKVKAGKHKVEVQAKGYVPDVKEIFLEPDEERALTLAPAIAGKPSRLTVTANVEGAEIFVEGKKQGVVPMKALDLPAGVARVTVMAEGYVAWEGDIELAEGKSVTADIKLIRDKKRISQVWFWTMLSLGAASAVAAGTTGYLALRKQDEYDRYVREFEDGTMANNSENQAAFKELADEGKKLVLATDILWVLTGASALTAGILAFFTQFRPPESKARFSLGPGPGPGPFMLTWSGKF